ncbi:homing endonuclease associated repeat-containing protein [Halosimplex amylolyticum]|uniref:homing endonuclease associated repeat-containing protein n=1 Tax=Halosimplex amylolyticum TaxID=3396616 RepID=UPI003F57868F
MATTEQECIESLQRAADILDTAPTKKEYVELELTPAASTIMRILGGWNEAKERAGLETYEQGENGGCPVQPKPDWVELPEEKEWEELSGYQRWYYKNREKEIQKKEDRREMLRGWLHRVKREQYECVRCGAGHPAYLDFHHTDSAEKDLGVGEMVSYGYAKESIRAEIENCEVLCANCHRREHYEVPASLDEEA